MLVVRSGSGQPTRTPNATKLYLGSPMSSASSLAWLRIALDPCITPEMSVQLESPQQARRRFPSSDELQISSSDQAVSRLGAANHTKPSPAEN
jgi:hypothetical protein